VGRLAETWVHRPPSPNRVVLDVTRRCNPACEAYPALAGAPVATVRQTVRRVATLLGETLAR
jgi:hypothetical protein